MIMHHHSHDHAYQLQWWYTLDTPALVVHRDTPALVLNPPAHSRISIYKHIYTYMYVYM